MPYKKQKKNKNYSKKNRSMPWYRRKFSPMEIASKAYSGVKYLKGLINTEKHYFDAGTTSTIDSTGAAVLLNGMAAGDDVNNRQGNSILAKTLYFQGYVRRDESNATVVNGIRLLIVKDLEGTGTAPTITDILNSASVVAPLNVDHLPRYQVLVDVRDVLIKDQTDGFMIKKFLRIDDHLKYTGTGATDVYKNALYLILYGDIAAASNPPLLQWTSRLGYYDN